MGRLSFICAIALVAIGMAGCAAPKPVRAAKPTTTWTGIGLVIGLDGHGDGPDFPGLVKSMAASKLDANIKPADAALVMITATSDGTDSPMVVYVSSIGTADRLNGGVLVKSVLYEPVPRPMQCMMVTGKLVVGKDHETVASFTTRPVIVPVDATK